MKQTIILSVISWVIIGCGLAGAGFVDLSPDEQGDRIAVVRDGKVAYLQTKRANIGSGKIGGGYCRYIRRTSNGNFYVTGPGGLGLFQSSDGGFSWTESALTIENMNFMSSFVILNDDTFLVSYMPPPSHEHKRMFMARSNDLGKTWESHDLDPDMSPCKYKYAWNGDMIQLADGMVLQTIDARVGPEGVHDEEGKLLPIQLRGGFLYVVRSHDKGWTWGEKSLLPGYGGEAHLLELPSGKVMVCVRKQRWYRLPGDPTSVLELKKSYGYSTVVSGGMIGDGEEGVNRNKNMFVSESYDSGYTWVNEQQVSQFMQCSGDMSYLEDGTLVLQYLHRYRGGLVADISIRARVSYDDGKTWEPEEYILSDGENYPGGIAMPGGGMIAMVPHKGQIQAVHWRPLPKNKPDLAYMSAPTKQSHQNTVHATLRPFVSIINGEQTTEHPATRTNILPEPPPSLRHSAIHDGRNSAVLQQSSNGDVYCAGNVLGQTIFRSQDNGHSWTSSDLDVQGWGSLAGFQILSDNTFMIVYEPAGGGNRNFFTARSTDYGKTWNVNMADLDIHPFTHVAGKDNNLLELPDGTLLMTAQVWGGQGGPDMKAPQDKVDGLACVFRSSDKGRTWRQPAFIAGLAGKSRIVSLKSGKMLACVYRIKAGTVDSLFIAESLDSGRSWHNKRKVITGLQPNGADLTQLKDGTLVMQFLHDSEPKSTIHNEFKYVDSLRAVISHDEGQTWENQVYVIGSSPGAYQGNSVELADGNILTACVNTSGSGMRLQAVKWHPASSN